MRVIPVLDQRAVTENILSHLGVWNGGQTPPPAHPPSDVDAGPWPRKPCVDGDPMPGYEIVLAD